VVLLGLVVHISLERSLAKRFKLRKQPRRILE
jgi:hypothetical protein